MRNSQGMRNKKKKMYSEILLCDLKKHKNFSTRNLISKGDIPFKNAKSKLPQHILLPVKVGVLFHHFKKMSSK